MKKNRVVIVGGGFGGINTALELEDTEFEVTIIDKTNHHLFQPLLYQVATAALSPADIARPIRAIFKEKRNIKVILAEVTDINTRDKKVITRDQEIEYDYLIVGTGARHSYFGHDEWEAHAPGLKTLNDALVLREKILCSLEEAEKIGNPQIAAKFLNFVIIGGGPTGVELAGSIAEIIASTISTDYRNISPGDTKVYLVEGMHKLLLPYPDELSQRAKDDLEKMGVKVLLKKMVTDVSPEGVRMGEDFIESTNMIWAAGNTASPLVKNLDAEHDRAGRVVVDYDLTIKDCPDVFIIGDAAAYKDDKGDFLPAVAQVAIQMGKYAASVIKRQIPHEKREPFRYNDKGIMATIGRAKAVADIKGFKLTGFIAWLVWSLVHVMFLIGYRNRFRVMAEWMWYYISYRHGMRLIVGRGWPY